MDRQNLRTESPRFVCVPCTWYQVRCPRAKHATTASKTAETLIDPNLRALQALFVGTIQLCRVPAVEKRKTSDSYAVKMQPNDSTETCPQGDTHNISDQVEDKMGEQTRPEPTWETTLTSGHNVPDQFFDKMGTSWRKLGGSIEESTADNLGDQPRDANTRRSIPDQVRQAWGQDRRQETQKANTASQR